MNVDDRFEQGFTVIRFINTLVTRFPCQRKATHSRIALCRRYGSNDL